MTTKAAAASLSDTHSRELEAAFELAHQAGEIAARYHGSGVDVDRKADDEPVTVADRECSALIVAGLRRAFPDDIVISEENPDDRRRLDAQRVWYIDPIDGTADFIRGENGFCVMIGLCEGHRPSLGVVHQPNEALTYVAAPGVGAHRAVGDGAFERIHCSAKAPLSDLRLVVSKSHRSKTIDRVKETLGTKSETRIGSIGLKLGLLATGSHDLYVTKTNKCCSWDTVAPAAILAEAGGRLTDPRGDELRYDQESMVHAFGLLASNGAVHDEVVSALTPIFSP